MSKSGRVPERQLIFDLAGAQHGLVARSQLRELGFSHQAISRLFRSTAWVPVTQQVLRSAGSPTSLEQMVLTAILDQGGDAALSHLSAAAWWGLTGCSLTPLNLVTTRKTGRKTELARVREVRLLPEWCVVTHRGCRVARPELVALHLFAVSSPGRAERLVDRMWSKRLLSGSSIIDVLDELGESGRNGVTGLRRYLKPRGEDYEPPASGLESRVLELLAGAGMSFRRQINSGGTRWTGRVDFRHATLPLIVEAQSEAYHSSLSDQAEDDRRTTQLKADGFVVVEVTDTDVFARPGEVVRRVVKALRPVVEVLPRETTA